MYALNQLVTVPSPCSSGGRCGKLRAINEHRHPDEQKNQYTDDGQWVAATGAHGHRWVDFDQGIASI
jgi:hypothetical protein